jgi:predicted ATPase
MSERNPIFITKLHLKNFRSIREETITFDNPLFLVGKNASGKSNILDAFDFLSRAMTIPLTEFRTSRGGRLSDYHFFNSDTAYFPDYDNINDDGAFSITVEFGNTQNRTFNASYALSFGFVEASDNHVIYGVITESCRLSFDGHEAWFQRNRQGFECSVPGIRPALSTNTLILPILGGLQEFEPIMSALMKMRVYNIEPSAIRRNEINVSESFLSSDGSNLASILWEADAHNIERIEELFQVVAPELLFATSQRSGEGVISPQNKMAFTVLRKRGSRSTLLLDTSISDGTLRALGHIVALMQDPLPSLIAIEEPELFLHIESQALLMDLIELASEKTQIIVSTHSPDLIDVKWLKPENLRVVEMENGETHVSPVSPTAADLIRRGKMYPGKLLRSNALDAA